MINSHEKFQFGKSPRTNKSSVSQRQPESKKASLTNFDKIWQIENSKDYGMHYACIVPIDGRGS
jgi:hypothetical protein